MASSTECPLFPKPRKGTGKSSSENRNRNNSELKQNASPMVIPGFSFAQVSNPNKSQQMAAQGSASLASNQTKNSNKAPENTEAINAIQNENSEFGYLQALLEIQKIFSLFPSLLSEMKKSHNFTNPADKLNCLLKGVCSSFTTLSMIKSFFGLSIFSWNADGVRSRIVEIRDFVDKHSPDILLLQETHLRPEHSFKIPNYICLDRQDHPALAVELRS
ncbi:hypothetical protein TNIN_141661 [Trichonephila inaurata madagascariensis]|uniref:Endonuclease/exonuclease/phosphatase domain-containing protein n=1 Tax=Trichonephila inaurata madagascariensis TaxID=2747483 RepID=A0A8X6YT12_9ARAC|nr:hypothetical protein TNIN_141661 [Trichonephila inaurata madagascariensis]